MMLEYEKYCQVLFSIYLTHFSDTGTEFLSTLSFSNQMTAGNQTTIILKRIGTALVRNNWLIEYCTR